MQRNSMFCWQLIGNYMKDEWLIRWMISSKYCGINFATKRSNWRTCQRSSFSRNAVAQFCNRSNWPNKTNWFWNCLANSQFSHKGLFSSSAIQEVSKIPHSNQRIHYWLKNSQKVANSARKTDFTGIWTFSGTVVFLSKGLPSSLIRASCIQTPPKRISKWWNYMGDYAHGCTWQTSDMQIRFDHERILNVWVYLSHLNSCECSF